MGSHVNRTAALTLTPNAMPARHPKPVTVAHDLLAKAPVIRISHTKNAFTKLRGYVRPGRTYLLVPFTPGTAAVNQLTRADARTRLDPSKRKRR